MRSILRGYNGPFSSGVGRVRRRRQENKKEQPVRFLTVQYYGEKGHGLNVVGGWCLGVSL